MTIEDRLTQIESLLQTLLREHREHRARRQHVAGRWATRQEAAEHLAVSVDTVDRMLRDGEIQGKRLGVDPEEVRRDKLGRRIDRRPVRIWIDGPPKTAEEIDVLAQEARAAQ